MRHYQITLERKDRSVRQWSLWAEHLVIGSDPRSTLVLPAPVAPRAAVLDHEGVVDLPIGRLLVHEDTWLRQSLWEKARDRMAFSRRMEWREPGANDRTRQWSMAALSLFGLLGIASVGLVKKSPEPPPNLPFDFDTYTVEVQTPPPPPPPPPDPEPERALRPDDHPTTTPDPSPNGGSTENNSVAMTDKTPAAVMKHSVLDMVNQMSDGALGELVDPDEKNITDVILAGGGGHMKKGIGGRGAGGGDDRMAGVHGVGLGYHGHDGVAAATAGGRPGPARVGGGSPMATRPVIRPPRPNDVVLDQAQGSRSPESILRVIRENIGGFKYTYQKYLRNSPELGGMISLQFTIAPSGDIIAIKVAKSNTGDAGLDTDIMDKARRMKFDQIEKGNVTVTYAFVLDRQ
ncbi:MAG: energy transducer TonB [Fibrobacteria bacterium]|nr:energy transducer TonB [Fibrobacteria bacterium]